MKFVRKTEVWRPTASGNLLIVLLAGILGGGLCLGLYPFFALNRPLPQPELVIVEGWLEDAALDTVRSLTASGTLFVTTGGPIKYGGNLLAEKSYAEAATARLVKLGVPPQSILTAPAPDTAKDRTYVSALAARRALEERGLFGRPANIYTLGGHSRRSLLTYRFAFGPEVPLGVVSLESEKVDLRHWWRSSMGFKHVMTELMSWIYVHCSRWKYSAGS
jgi:hypothetical protein